MAFRQILELAGGGKCILERSELEFDMNERSDGVGLVATLGYFILFPLRYTENIKYEL